VAWDPTVKGNPHLFITGIPGQGKSVTVARILTELARSGIPALVYDFHGEFSDPAHAYHRIAHPTVIDATEGLPFSPFEADGKTFSDVSQTLSSIFGSVFKLGDIQRDVLYTAIRGAYTARGFGKPGVVPPLPTARNVLQRLEMETDARSRTIVARCRQLFESDIFRTGEIVRSFTETLQGGTVLALDTLVSEEQQLAVSAFVLRKLYRDMFARGPATAIRLAIVLDEAHRLARDVTLPRLMKEGRKYGVAVIVASQGLADFHPDVRKNVGSTIAFRTTVEESRKVAGFFTGVPGQDIVAALQALTVGNALVQTATMRTYVTATMLQPEDNG